MLRDAGILNEFNDIPVGLRQGFFCGLEKISLTCTSIPPNHYTSQEDEDFVIIKYTKEVALGRILHGYDPDFLFSLIRHFCTAPLAVINQSSNKCCVMVNHSYPKNRHCIDLESLPHNASQKYNQPHPNLNQHCHQFQEISVCMGIFLQMLPAGHRCTRRDTSSCIWCQCSISQHSNPPISMLIPCDHDQRTHPP